jgi:hypothetical protein
VNQPSLCAYEMKTRRLALTLVTNTTRRATKEPNCSETGELRYRSTLAPCGAEAGSLYRRLEVLFRLLNPHGDHSGCDGHGIDPVGMALERGFCSSGPKRATSCPRRRRRLAGRHLHRVKFQQRYQKRHGGLPKPLFTKGLCLRGIPQLSAPFKQPILGA